VVAGAWQRLAGDALVVPVQILGINRWAATPEEVVLRLLLRRKIRAVDIGRGRARRGGRGWGQRESENHGHGDQGEGRRKHAHRAEERIHNENVSVGTWVIVVHLPRCEPRGDPFLMIGKSDENSSA
jgi:hypothetical protein